MDPLSIVCGTSALIGQTARVAKLLYDLRGTLKDAPLLLNSIMTECTVVRTTLCALEDMQSRRNNRFSLVSEQIFNSFSMAVACCELILADLERDAQTCLRAGKDPSDKDAVRRCRMILSKEHLQELLMQLNGQKQAIQLLLTTWQSRNEEQMRQREADNRDVLRGIARRVMRKYTDSEKSTHDSNSINSFDKFAFDKELLSAPCYQRAIRYLRKMESRQTELGGSTPEIEPEHQPVGLGISSIISEDYDSVINPPSEYESPTRLSQDGEIEAPQTPVISISYHSDAPDTVLTGNSINSIDSILSQPSKEEDTQPRKFAYKRRSMPPLYSHIQAVAMSPDALLGVVARAQRHRRARSEGNEAISDSPITNPKSSPLSSSFRDSAISDSSSTFDNATKDDFNADFDEFWILQDHREHYRSVPMPGRKFIFLGDPCIRPLWSTVDAVPISSDKDDTDDIGNAYNLRVAIDDVELELQLLDMTGEHDDYATGLLEPEAHIAVIVYAIDNPYSLRDVADRWAKIIQNIYPALPLILLGWGCEVRQNAQLIQWMKGMGQEPVTYSTGAALFRSLRAEAFLEMDTDDPRDAIDLFETLTKTSIRLHHEELRGITPVDFEGERKRRSQLTSFFAQDLSPPLFSILPQQRPETCRRDFAYELDTTRELRWDEQDAAREAFRQAQNSQYAVRTSGTNDDSMIYGQEDFQTRKLIRDSMFDVESESEDTDSSAGYNLNTSSILTDNNEPDLVQEIEQPHPMPRKPVLLRIDTDISQQCRPKIVEISKPPQDKPSIQLVQHKQAGQGFPSLGTYLEQHLLQYPVLQEGSWSREARRKTTMPAFECATCQAGETGGAGAPDDSPEAHDLLDIPGSKKEPQRPQPLDGGSSPYILPDLPEFESLTPKVMDTLFAQEFELWKL